MNFTLKQLEIFRAVAQSQHMGQAADRLFLTKGAVSQGLQELERQLGLQLFDRVHPRMHLNHEGQRLLPMADEVLHRARDIALTFSQEQSDHFLEIGCSKTIGSYLMPELVKNFEMATTWFPEVHLANTKELCGRVASFSLDLALLEGDERHPDLMFEPWLADEMVVMAHKDHPLCADYEHGIEALAGQRWVLREPASGSREYFDHKLAPLLPSYTVALTLSAPEAIVGAVAEGIGLTFTSRLMAGQSLFTNRLKVIPLAQRFPRRFSLAYHAKKYQSVSMRQFMEYCRVWQRRGEGGGV